MCIRLSRLRFIVIRSCIISFIIILFLQISTYFNNINNISQEEYDKLLSFEQKFWRKLFRQDKILSDNQRIEQIKLINNQYKQEIINWTDVFLNGYTKKLSILDERDSKTIYKYHFQDNQLNASQDSFDIYEETTVFNQPKFCSSTRIFHPKCPYSNCRWSCNTPSMNINNHRRASIFHHVDIKEDDIREKLKHRSPNDIWILWIDEANREIKDLNQYLFNWTLSFRQDSEVSIGSYGILIQRYQKMDFVYNNSDFLQILADKNIQVTDMFVEYRIFMNFRSRRKHALWFVSNCSPQRRLKYYEELKLHYPIKAFGTCVENKCDKNQQCEFEESHLALFYLAFESQTCTDYITEKFWRALYYGMIPIVLGSTKQSYLDLGIPESAFIHIDYFKSASALAEYLHQISNDYFLYRQYFQWLNQYEVFYDINELEPIRMCELCMRLNMQPFEDHRFYINVHDWHRTGC